MESEDTKKKRDYLFFEGSQNFWDEEECKLFLKGLLLFWGNSSFIYTEINYIPSEIQRLTLNKL